MGKPSADWEGASIPGWGGAVVCRSPDPVSGPGGGPGVAGSGDGGCGGEVGRQGRGRGSRGREGAEEKARGGGTGGGGGGGMESAFQTGDTQLCSVGQRGGSAPFSGRSLGSSSPERKIRWVEPGWKENSWQSSPAPGCHPSRLHSNATSLKPSGIHPWLPGSRGAPGEAGFILLLIDLGWRELGVTCRLLFSGPYGG